MTINILTISFLFLFLPGLICAVLTSKLTTHRELRPTDFLIPSFIYGFFIFIIYELVSVIWDSLFPISWKFPEFELIPASPNLTAPQISVLALCIAVIIGLLLSVITSALKNNKILYRTAQQLKITRKFGDRDVWSFIMNSDKIEWVVVRDTKNGLYNVGKLSAFLDEEEQRELVLENTIVYDNESGVEKYDAGTVYFSFERENLILELPNM